MDRVKYTLDTHHRMEVSQQIQQTTKTAILYLLICFVLFFVPSALKGLHVPVYVAVSD